MAGAVSKHRMSEARPLPEWFVDQQQVLFLQVERPLLTLLPELDEAARRTLARTLFSAVHGIVCPWPRGKARVLTLARSPQPAHGSRARYRDGSGRASLGRPDRVGLIDCWFSNIYGICQSVNAAYPIFASKLPSL